MQLQIQFKQVPENAQWYVAGEIDGAVNASLGQKLASKFLLTAIKCWDKTMTYSLGAPSSRAFISSSLDRWFEIKEPIAAGQAYNWETGNRFLDAEHWQVVTEGRTLALTPFWGSRPLRVVLFARQGQAPEWIRVLEIEFAWRGHESDVV
jgi:hypothetical protein